MDYHYKLVCGQYVLHDGDGPIGQPRDEVMLCFDAESGTLHKHGAPEAVSRWHQEAQKKYRNVGFHEMADQLVAITGRFPLEELNRCLSTSGYVARMYDRLKDGALAPVPLQ